MNVKVDKEKCIGCGQCVSICEEVFDFDDDNLAKVIQSPVNKDNEEATNIAVESCPTEAIIKAIDDNIEEDNGTLESCPTEAIINE